MRIVSLCPSNSEILFAIGAGDQVVAVEKWTDFPPEAARLPSVGTEMSVDMELLRSFRPDLVLASLSVPGMERNVRALEEAALPHMVLDPHGIEDIYGDIVRVGDAVGCGAAARSLVQSMRDEIAGLRCMNAARSAPARVYVEWWPKPAITPGRRSWTHEMIEAAGGANIFADIDAPSRPVDYADVVARDPELILLCWAGIHRDEIDPLSLLSRKGWSRLNVVDQKRVHVVEEGWYGRPGPRIVKGIRQMAELIAGLD